jgi:hypothetical protein
LLRKYCRSLLQDTKEEKARVRTTIVGAVYFIEADDDLRLLELGRVDVATDPASAVTNESIEERDK